MAGSLTRRVTRMTLLVAGAMLVAVCVTSCGDDDGGAITETSGVPTTQAGGEGDGGTADGDAGGTPGGSGIATVTVSAGTFELQVEEACVISDVGIGVTASSSEGSLTIAGPKEVAVVVFDLSSGDQWSAAAANVVIDGTTMTFSGPAMGAGSTISVQVFCADVVTGPGG